MMNTGRGGGKETHNTFPRGCCRGVTFSTPDTCNSEVVGLIAFRGASILNRWSKFLKIPTAASVHPVWAHERLAGTEEEAKFPSLEGARLFRSLLKWRLVCQQWTKASIRGLFSNLCKVSCIDGQQRSHTRYQSILAATRTLPIPVPCPGQSRTGNPLVIVCCCVLCFVVAFCT